jgi:exopolyphosphatase/guanosine-5'-triphosphate,3'-diphosphate pyrophosphatase
MDKTLEALARFRLLGREIGLKRLHVVATAAVRDAANGPDFLKRIAALGLKPRLLPGDEEAELSGLGVISAIPNAHGVVVDLGGGSLELIGVARGNAGEGVSLPLGVLRLGDQPKASDLLDQIRVGVKGSRLADAARDRSLYLVGGSFRALAQLDLKDAKHPLPIVHQHGFTAQRIAEIRAMLRDRPLEEIKALSGVSSARVPTLPAAAAVLDALARLLGPKRIIASAFGLREGIL